jgi:hypothetical protein
LERVIEDDLYRFFEDFASQLRFQGVLCAITSGLACVHYGVSETTKDCDLLCHPSSFETLLNTLMETTIAGCPCHYRGNISPPLDGRWHRGGWTSHFQWDTEPDATMLDVFGHAIRESTPWTEDVIGLYAGPHTVAGMKRTSRDKDWSAITALGVRMVEADDERGWLHIYDAELLAGLLQEHRCPVEITALRPAIRMAVNGDRHLAGALNAERKLWEELDRLRVRVFEAGLRPYVSAVRRARTAKPLTFREEHLLRVDCAERHLPKNPLNDHGIEKYIEEAKRSMLDTGLIPERALPWLPKVINYFQWLNQ